MADAYKRGPLLVWLIECTALMQHTCPENVDAHFARSRRCHLYLFDFQGLACTPANSGFTLDRLSSGSRHCGAQDDDGKRVKKIGEL